MNEMTDKDDAILPTPEEEAAIRLTLKAEAVTEASDPERRSRILRRARRQVGARDLSTLLFGRVWATVIILTASICAVFTREVIARKKTSEDEGLETILRTAGQSDEHPANSGGTS